MKEFSAQNGGRYTYADDLINLQDLALSFVSIYDGCENFIISGCEVSGSTVSEGYVYINKKIRRFNGATGVSFPGYIYENDITETIEYVTGGSKVGRNIFGCAYGTSVPSGKQYISFNRSGVGLRLKDAFFGANCLLLSKQIQQILGNVSLTGNFTASGSVEANAVTLKTLNFKNASNNVVAAFGISSGNTLSLTNSNGNINITGQSFVDIGPAIKENGQLLSTKYVNRSELQSWVFGDAPTGGMTQSQCDARYARLSNGLSQFITGGNTAQVLCGQIGAMNQSTADNRYARLSEFLADMATNETNKQKIRENIGAASLAQVNPVNDTGWITFNNGTMHARQWGRMVSVYGTVSISADARNAFTLPNDIGAPAYDLIVTLCYTGDNASRQNTIVIKIEQGEKTAVVLSRFVADTVQMNNLIVSFNYMV
jgi:hypothetical protein